MSNNKLNKIILLKLAFNHHLDHVFLLPDLISQVTQLMN